MTFHSIIFGFIGLVLLTFCVENNKAQSSNPIDSSILVNSWKVGDSKILEQVLALDLEKELDELEFDIYNTTKQKHFRLRLRQDFVRTTRTPSVPCWVAVFKEVVKDDKSKGNIIGYDLLNTEGPGVGDYFPREGWAKYLCPVEKPNSVLDGPLYPIGAERKFLIEKFMVILQVSDYQLDKKENRLEKMTLRVEFKNQEQKVSTQSKL